MKKSQLREIINKEIRNMMNEGLLDKLVKFTQNLEKTIDKGRAESDPDYEKTLNDKLAKSDEYQKAKEDLIAANKSAEELLAKIKKEKEEEE